MLPPSYATTTEVCFFWSPLIQLLRTVVRSILYGKWTDCCRRRNGESFYAMCSRNYEVDRITLFEKSVFFLSVIHKAQNP